MYKIETPVSSFIQIRVTVLELLHGRGDVRQLITANFAYFYCRFTKKCLIYCYCKSYVYSCVTKIVRGLIFQAFGT